MTEEKKKKSFFSLLHSLTSTEYEFFARKSRNSYSEITLLENSLALRSLSLIEKIRNFALQTEAIHYCQYGSLTKKTKIVFAGTLKVDFSPAKRHGVVPTD